MFKASLITCYFLLITGVFARNHHHVKSHSTRHSTKDISTIASVEEDPESTTVKIAAKDIIDDTNELNQQTLSTFNQHRGDTDVYYIIWLKIRETYEKVVHSCENKSLFRYHGEKIKEKKDVEIDDDIQCINCLIQDFDNLRDWNCPEDSSIPVKKFLSKTEANDTLIRKVRIASDVSYFKNRSNRTQSGQTTARSESFTDTTEYSVTTGGKITSKGKIGIPLVGDTEVSVELSALESHRSVHTHTHSITAQSQKVEVAAKSWIKTGWVLYETEHRYDYTIDLEVDDSLPEYNSQRFRKFKELNEEDGFPHFYNKESGGVHLKMKGGKIILSNVPVSENVVAHSIAYDIGLEQSLDVPMPSDAIVIDMN